MSTNPASVPLLLAPSLESLQNPDVPGNVPIDATASVKLDNLGPMITLSRIANWEHMTEAERDRTMRVLAARNRARLAKQQKDDSDTSSTSF
ncbi:hypothetical protein JVU11DRAFT_9002 [Chiua virens]|nr:hypothetical protein JVU11DRAFT_9002 [Chiua virens]